MTDKKNDIFGDKIKALESISAKETLDENLPIMVRIDGKAFHTFTRGLKRPYDARLSKAMIDTMNYLLDKTDARLGYTQSDEITLVYFKVADNQQGYFGSRVQKLVSILSSMATAKFNKEVELNIPEKKDIFAFFDCRVWNVPTLKDAAEVFVWRQEDAIKNAISMAAHAYYSHGSLQKKKSSDKIQLLKEKGIEWADYPEFFKSGTYAIRGLVEEPMPEELRKLKTNENKETYVRSQINNYSLDRLSKLENYEDVLFGDVFKNRKIKVDHIKKNKMK